MCLDAELSLYVEQVRLFCLFASFSMRGDVHRPVTAKDSMCSIYHHVSRHVTDHCTVCRVLLYRCSYKLPSMSDSTVQNVLFHKSSMFHLSNFSTSNKHVQGIAHLGCDHYTIHGVFFRHYVCVYNTRDISDFICNHPLCVFSSRMNLGKIGIKKIDIL